ncbi:MAG: hypothetical protein EZS28_029772 [Streblomastix strix]|uniref:Protein transport protein SEC23 n=1 Tax=Streblomastix strix TaxID=222440 RepID=A0A5J4UX22_9EUKA|nr:MAG: hypothetical protein EZS28_029772 [Streblomastix strix]
MIAGPFCAESSFSDTSHIGAHHFFFDVSKYTDNPNYEIRGRNPLQCRFCSAFYAPWPKNKEDSKNILPRYKWECGFCKCINILPGVKRLLKIKTKSKAEIDAIIDKIIIKYQEMRVNSFEHVFDKEKQFIRHPPSYPGYSPAIVFIIDENFSPSNFIEIVNSVQSLLKNIPRSTKILMITFGKKVTLLKLGYFQRMKRFDNQTSEKPKRFCDFHFTLTLSGRNEDEFRNTIPFFCLQQAVIGKSVMINSINLQEVLQNEEKEGDQYIIDQNLYEYEDEQQRQFQEYYSHQAKENKIILGVAERMASFFCEASDLQENLIEILSYAAGFHNIEEQMRQDNIINPNSQQQEDQHWPGWR